MKIKYQRSPIKLVKKLTIILVFTFCIYPTFGFMANGQKLEETKVSLSFINTSLIEIFESIENQTPFSFLYDLKTIESPLNLTYSEKEISMKEALALLSKDTNLLFEKLNRTITVTKLTNRSNRNKKPLVRTITGTVKDSNGNPLPGSNIIVKGYNVGAVTDFDGAFILEVPDNATTLTVSYLGYVTKEISISVKNEYSIILEEDPEALEEVVIIGYGAMRKSDLTGSMASIKREDIIDQPVYSLSNALQGKAPGVLVTQSGFRPGQGSNLLIRGKRSLAGSNSPLILVDGVPFSINDVNPNDVASIEVLKDASASAIYGSRAANGVILISTRRGNVGKLTIEYNGYAGVQNTFKRLDLMDTPSYAEFFRDAYRLEDAYVDDESLFAPWQLEAIANNQTTDWQDLVFDLGFQQNHTLSVRGGTTSTKYSLSGSFDEHKATVANNDYKRYSFRFNIDQEIKPWLRVGASGYLSDSYTHQSVAFTDVLQNSPMATPYDEDGKISMLNELGDRNPLFDMQRENNLNESITTRITGTFFVEADILPNLSFRTNFTPNFSFLSNGTYRRDNTSVARKSGSRALTTLTESMFTFNKTIFEKHKLHITALYGVQKSKSESYSINVQGLPYEHQLYHNLGSAETINGVGSNLSESKLESYMLRVNYGFDNRYLVTLTGRIDGASVLADGNKYATFPSMAIAWNASNEGFMEDVDVLSNLKLRLSVGVTGSSAISPYSTQGTLALGDYYSFSGTDYKYFQHGSIPNPNLKWERTLSKNIGVDFGLWGNRLVGNIDVYQNDTYDLLMKRNLPITSGYSSVLKNVGETRNTGLELGLSSQNVNSGDFSWETDINFSTNKNELVSLYGSNDDDIGNLWFIGEPIDVNYDWVFDGIWQLEEADEAAIYGDEPGEIRVKDLNNDNKIDNEDKKILGTPDPKWVAGITNRFKYKNIDFSFLIYTVQGTQHYSVYGASGYQDLLSLQAHAYQNNMRNIQYWLPDRQSTTYGKPRIGSQGRNDTQAYFDTSFLRIKNITLGYNMPQDKLSEFGIGRARLYASVENPFTFTSFGGYDPEAARGYNMPNYTTFLIGLNLSF